VQIQIVCLLVVTHEVVHSSCLDWLAEEEVKSTWYFREKDRHMQGLIFILSGDSCPEMKLSLTVAEHRLC
jgi:hypothetical protein